MSDRRRNSRTPPPHRPRRLDPARRGPRPTDSPYETVHLSDDMVRELRATARPGKGDILVKVFADAVAAYAAGDHKMAIELGEQAKHMALRAVPPRELLGLIYYEVGRYPDASKELAAFRRLSGSSDQNPILADTYRALGKPEKALDLADEMDPRRVEVATYYEGQIVAAGALADLGRVDEAIARIERLDLRPEEARPHHLRAWYVLADLLERKGRFTQAKELFEAVVAADPDATDASTRLEKLR